LAGFDTSKLGFSSACLAGKTLPQAADIGRAMGFRTYEMLAFDGYCHSQGTLSGFYFEHMTADEREDLRELASRFDYVSTHAPFIDIASVAPNPSIRAAAQRQLEIAIEGVAFIGGVTTTTHVTPKHIHPFEQFKGEVIDLYRRLGDIAGELGVTVTCETCYPPAVDEFADLIWSIDHPAVGANVDVGHLVVTIPPDLRGTDEGIALYNDTLEEHVRSLKGKLFHFHLHDIRPDDFRDHRAAGRGFLDYERLFRVVAQMDYEGLFVFELEEPDLEDALAGSKARIELAMSRVAAGDDGP